MFKALLLACLAALPLFSAQAQVYQWKDANGKTIISDSPPPASTKGQRTVGSAQPVSKSEPAAEKPAEPQSMADKEVEFRKRQQETREKAEKKAKDDQAERDRRENCERARRNVALLQSQEPVSNIGANGQREMLEGQQRQRELERARRVVSESCK